MCMCEGETPPQDTGCVLEAAVRYISAFKRNTK